MSPIKIDLLLLDFDVENSKAETKDLYTLGHLYYDIVIGLVESSNEESICDNMSQYKTQLTRRVVREKELAETIQHFYLRLLRRYLNQKHGEIQGHSLMIQYNEALSKVRIMRRIQLEETLQL